MRQRHETPQERRESIPPLRQVIPHDGDHHHMSSPSKSSTNRRQQHSHLVFPCLLSFLSGCFLASFFLLSDIKHNNYNYSFLKKGCRISFGTYRGSEYRTDSTVGDTTCLVESKFLKVQQHSVRLPNHQDVSDWLWIDYHDRINVLVRDETENFLVFEQTKYALEGRESLAIVGGIIEPGEMPEESARREVGEEMNLMCKEYHLLGRYRTDVNRGMGWTNCFLATSCRNKEAGMEDGGGGTKDEVGVQDMERQDLKTLTVAELRQAVQAGRFLEIQWTATVSLSLLHLSQEEQRKKAS